VKVCTRCGGPGPFEVARGKRDGLSSQCKACRKLYRNANLESARARNKAWCSANSEAHKAKKRAWYERNRSRIKAKCEAYVQTHREAINAQHRAADSLRRGQINALKRNVPCADCGAIFDSFCMDFDHVSGSKRESVSQMCSCSLATVLEEVSKCELVCANCHRIRTESRKCPSRNPYRQALRLRFNDAKDKPCSDCGKRFHPSAMEFDHVRGGKALCVSEIWSWTRALEEIAKCDLVCSVCHRKRTQTRRGQGSPQISKATIDRRTKIQVKRARVINFKEQGAPLLGTMPDRALARRFGIDHSTVAEYRRILGIPLYHEADGWRSLLGTMSDRALARFSGKNPEVVRRKRNELGIPAFVQRHTIHLGV
jgi:hypothetical protein